jgi:hypothetical protein
MNNILRYQMLHDKLRNCLHKIMKFIYQTKCLSTLFCAVEFTHSNLIITDCLLFRAAGRHKKCMNCILYHKV